MIMVVSVVTDHGFTFTSQVLNKRRPHNDVFRNVMSNQTPCNDLKALELLLAEFGTLLLFQREQLSQLKCNSIYPGMILFDDYREG